MTAAAKETEWRRRQRRTAERAAHGAAHGPGCELCGNTPKKRGLDQDHDHVTGLTRGWLCFRCNKFLHGWMTPEWLRKAATYLEERS